MAYPVVAGSILEFIVQGRVSGQVCMTVLHFKYTGSTTITDGKQALTDFLANINVLSDVVGALAGCMADQAVINQVRAQWIYPTRYVYETAVPAALSGTRAGAPVSANTSAALEKRTEKSGRDQRGIMHLWGILASDMDDGFLSASLKTAMATLANRLDDTRTITGGYVFAPVIYHKAAPGSSPILTGCVIYDTVRTMRRRTVGRGI